ncbi:MAG: argininosuccinate lyase [Planctomycetota bacterium]|jgi:argininosuccinate lyase
MGNEKNRPLWGGRFKENTDAAMVSFNASIGFDCRLFPQDIAVNRAWAKALKNVGVLVENELEEILKGLNRVEDEMAMGKFDPDEKLEDIHTAVESRLFEIVGETARKLHTGRSRNDQVATDFRLFVTAAADETTGKIRALQKAVVALAKKNIHIVMPGYTHMQRAQPVRFSHWVMALFWMLERDRERITGAGKRADIMPLGAGALAGSAFDIDRSALAKELGFSCVSDNSIDAVSDRDFATEFASALAILTTHLSRYAEDMIIWSTSEFGFIKLPDAFSTGSSMMPQKKNPDSLELIRGKSGRVFGDLTTLLAIQKGVPLTYAKDLQEDKEPVFDAFDSASACIVILAGVLESLKVNEQRIKENLEADDSIFATDIADYLVRKDVPFREAHNIVGRLVAHAEEKEANLSGLPLKTYKKFSALFEKDVFAIFETGAGGDIRAIDGGTSLASVEKQIADAEKLLL